MLWIVHKHIRFDQIKNQGVYKIGYKLIQRIDEWTITEQNVPRIYSSL